jgi:hypothetical protein
MFAKSINAETTSAVTIVFHIIGASRLDFLTCAGFTFGGTANLIMSTLGAEASLAPVLDDVASSAPSITCALSFLAILTTIEVPCVVIELALDRVSTDPTVNASLDGVMH